jgi:hypothetical protein
MRKLWSLLAVGVLVSGVALAAEEVTLTGDAVCAKCALKEKEAKTCQNVVMVKEGGKTVNYYLKKNAFSTKAHQGLGICGATKADPVKVKVTGTVATEDGKKVLTATKDLVKAD